MSTLEAGLRGYAGVWSPKAYTSKVSNQISSAYYVVSVWGALSAYHAKSLGSVEIITMEHHQKLDNVLNCVERILLA